MIKAWLLAAVVAAAGGGAAPGSAPLDSTPAPAPAPSAPLRSEQCDAASLVYLVGKPRSEIPVPIDPSRRRVYCSSCIVTEDYRPERTDIVFDTDTGLVTAVKCG